MAGQCQSRISGPRRFVRSGVAVVALTFFSVSSLAQYHNGPPTTTIVGGHNLAPPATVTWGGGYHLPPPLPSVTSIPNTGYIGRRYGGYYGGYHRGRGRGYGYNGGLGYVAPYYIPLDAYGYDYVGGPDVYSGPPMGPNEQTLHIIVEQPPVATRPDPQEFVPPTQAAAPSPAAEVNSLRGAKPGEPTVLVFRDGHQREVTNYAIMGPTLYVFDKHRDKIALSDLDVAATVKANDERGLEFNLPPAPRSAEKKSPAVEPKNAPDQSTPVPSKIASALPS